MRKGLLTIALGLFLVAKMAAADVLTVPVGEPTPPITLPAKGITMADVEAKFGEPRTKRPTVGGGSPKQPPITRWDYDAFSVIFEHDRVVDAVIPGAPPKIVNRKGLQPVEVPVIAPSVTYTPVEAPAEAAPMVPETMSSESPAAESAGTATAPETPAEAPAEPATPAESMPAAPQETAPPAEPSSESEEPKPLP